MPKRWLREVVSRHWRVFHFSLCHFWTHSCHYSSSHTVPTTKSLVLPLVCHLILLLSCQLWRRNRRRRAEENACLWTTKKEAFHCLNHNMITKECEDQHEQLATKSRPEFSCRRVELQDDFALRIRQVGMPKIDNEYHSGFCWAQFLWIVHCMCERIVKDKHITFSPGDLLVQDSQYWSLFATIQGRNL